MTDAYLEAAQNQDRALVERGIEVWVGCEPTFTRADSSEPCWLDLP